MVRICIADSSAGGAEAICNLLERELDGQQVLAAVNGRQDTVEFPFEGEVLHLHYGRNCGRTLSLDPWGSALVLFVK